MRTLYLCYFGLREPLVQTQVLPYLRQLSRGGIDVGLLTFEPNRRASCSRSEAGAWCDRLKAAIIAYLGCLTAVNAVYVATDFWVTRSRWRAMADVVGLPAFLIGFWLVCELVRVGQCYALTTGPSRSRMASARDWPADGGRPRTSLGGC